MESLGHEVVPFEDVVCQMWDMLKLGDRSYVTLQVRRFTRRDSRLSERNIDGEAAKSGPLFLLGPSNVQRTFYAT